MDFVPLLVGAAMVAVLVDVVRSARSQEWNGVITPLAAWAIGILIVFLLGESDFGSDLPIGDTGHTVGDVNGFSLILLGFAFGSVAAKGVDLIKAVDNTDSQKRPPLIDDTPKPQD